MVKKATEPRKGAGRPVTVGADQMIAAKFPSDLVKRIDQWARDNGAIGRSAALRRLVELGLKAVRRVTK